MIFSLRACTRLTSNILTNLSKSLPFETQAADQCSTVYLTHMKWVTGKRQITKYFSRYGKVQDVLLFFDAETGLHKGFATVTFESAVSANAAIQNRPHVIDGDIVGVELHIPLKNKKEKFKTM